VSPLSQSLSYRRSKQNQSASLSVLIITFNEEANIERCLKSIDWANETIVIDSQSTDRTVEICSKFTDKIISHPFANYSDQKNVALAQATEEWILSIDADEELTAELSNEIQSLLKSDPQLDGYKIPRKSIIFGRTFRFSGTQKDRPVRLFRRGAAKFEQPIHEYVALQGPTGELNGQMLHYTYENITSYLSRFDRYTSMEARFLAASRSRVSVIDWLFRPPAMFLKLYVIMQGFRDGFEGFLFCFFSGWYVFVKYVKCMELLNERQIRVDTN